MFPSFYVVFPLLLRNLEIPTQESNANSTEISIYKTQFLSYNSEQKKKGMLFIKTMLQKCFNTANFDRLAGVLFRSGQWGKQGGGRRCTLEWFAVPAKCIFD